MRNSYTIIEKPLRRHWPSTVCTHIREGCTGVYTPICTLPFISIKDRLLRFMQNGAIHRNYTARLSKRVERIFLNFISPRRIISTGDSRIQRYVSFERVVWNVNIFDILTLHVTRIMSWKLREWWTFAKIELKPKPNEKIITLHRINQKFVT